MRAPWSFEPAGLRPILTSSISVSILTQALASAGSFILSIAMLRLLPLEKFGFYVYLLIFAGFSTQMVNAGCGNVYHLLRPKLSVLRKSYEENYGAIHLLVLSSATLASVAACLLLSPELETQVGVMPLALFIVAITGYESLKLQATANASHHFVLVIELLRQAALLGSVVLLAWYARADLPNLVLANACTALLACAGIMTGIRRRLSVKRFGWVAQRHFRYARYLMPTVLLAQFHVGVIWIFAGHRFGPEALGILRAAELPFNMLNPLKASLAHFLPAMAHTVERRNATSRRRTLMRAASLVPLFLLACLALWAISIPLYPLLTKKEYPAGIGLIFCAIYFLFTLNAVFETWLNTINRSSKVFIQALIGAAVSMGAYFATSPFLGLPAAAVAVALSTLAMALYSGAMLRRHWRGR